MSLIVKVSKDEANKVVSIADKLTLLCEKRLQEEGAYLYLPRAGRLVNVINILNEARVAYKIEFEYRSDEHGENRL
jgi:hypothetical protein